MSFQMEEIIHHCLTVFGDCITGFVSSYIFRYLLEKYTQKKIKLSINWRFVNCPYIKPIHINQSRINRRQCGRIDCRYSGQDGTLAFSQYYMTPRMIHQIRNKKILLIKTNQYLGKCFIDDTVDRQTIEKLTYEAYRYFWEEVLDQSQIIDDLPTEITRGNFEETLVVQSRLGDQYLSSNRECDPKQLLEKSYQLITDSPINLNSFRHVVLIGDVENQLMKECFIKVHDNCSEKITIFDGLLGHTVQSSSNKNVWMKIMIDLYLILKSQTLIITNTHSNFARICMFMRDNTDHRVYYGKDNQLVKLDDLSLFFAQHYQF